MDIAHGIVGVPQHLGLSQSQLPTLALGPVGTVVSAAAAHQEPGLRHMGLGHVTVGLYHMTRGLGHMTARLWHGIRFCCVPASVSLRVITISHMTPRPGHMTGSNGRLKRPSGQIFKAPPRHAVRLLAIKLIDTLRGREKKKSCQQDPPKPSSLTDTGTRSLPAEMSFTYTNAFLRCARDGHVITM